MATTIDTKSQSRFALLDNVRIGLIVLVVLHHVAMAYGAAGLGFYYVELPPEGFSRGMLIFLLANQAWFMGAFFFIAGYLTPDSLERKGTGRFLQGRVMRLGIPLVVYSLLLNPLSMFGWFLVPEPLTRMTWDSYEYLDYVRMGPMWFVALLLIFSFGYSIWRRLVTAKDVSPTSLKLHHIALFAVVLAAISLALRQWIPVGEEWFGFPSLAYLPQYLAFFLLGTVASRRQWLTTIRTRVGWVGLSSAVVAAILLFPYGFSGEMFSIELGEGFGPGFGDAWTWQAAAYSLWDSITAVGLTLFLIVGGRRLWSGSTSLTRWLAGNAYAVYVIHIPTIVFLAAALQGIEMNHTLKFFMVGAIAVPVCFTVAAAVRRIPGVSKIL